MRSRQRNLMEAFMANEKMQSYPTACRDQCHLTYLDAGRQFEALCPTLGLGFEWLFNDFSLNKED
jgi:hypothetical protein|tara:strand:+ start:190 stop:384 length:195 start_codon:yes stop_codon:yes gene_type:complete